MAAALQTKLRAPEARESATHAENLGRRRTARSCSDGGGPTLEMRISGVWEGLTAAGVADCLICGKPMHRDGSGGGSCGSCGTRVS